MGGINSINFQLQQRRYDRKHHIVYLCVSYSKTFAIIKIVKKSKQRRGTWMQHGDNYAKYAALEALEPLPLFWSHLLARVEHTKQFKIDKLNYDSKK